MKKGVTLFLGFFVFFYSLAGVVAAIGPACDLSVSLINQDPYPAIQGEEAKIVFQIDGVENPDCGTISFSLLDKYPITLSPDQQQTYTFESGTYSRNFESFFLAQYKVRIAQDALDGSSPIEVSYKYGKQSTTFQEEFDLEIKDTHADFEVYVKDYDPTTGILTLEILNIADVDVEALTVEIPKQDGITVKGAKTNIVGDLDSNEYTTADFEATPKDGTFKVKLLYSDKINERRVVEKEISFESEYFIGRNGENNGSSTWTWIILLIVVVGISYWFYRRHKKKKMLKNRR